jgi:hypothetical protein
VDALEWLLDADPALRWQVERDLAGHAGWQDTRARVPHEGFGARLLALQDDDGQWAGGAFFPADHDWSTPQPFTATTWALNALREWGVEADVLGDTAARLAVSSRWEYEDLPYWDGEVDCCINSYTLANGAWLGVDVTGLLQWFADHQLGDGGWNCEWVNGASVSSFHSTLNSLKGLLSYQEFTGTDTSTLRAPGQEYLLSRSLLHRAGTGELVGPWVGEFTYPFRWGYSALNALDHLRAAGVRDPRTAAAVDLVRSLGPDGTWTQAPRFEGTVWFPVDEPPGEPSRWVTFLARRALAFHTP